MRLLRLRDFRLLVLSNGLSSLGDELALVALTIKVFDVSHSGIAVSAVLLAGIVPLVVFSPLSGLIVDRTESTGTLAIASAIQAGLAVALAFVDPVWAIVTLSFLLGSVASVASPAVGEGGRPKGEARKGFAFIARDRVLLIAVIAIAATVLFAAMDNVAEVFFARNVLDAGNWGYGALAAVWLAGMVVGAGVIARRLPDARLAPAVLVAAIGGGVAVAVAAAFPSIGLALTMFALGGVANGVVSVAMRSLLHHRVPDQLRGRVFSAYFGVVMAGQLGATALGGVLVATLGSRSVLLIGGIGGAVIGLVGLVAFAALPRSSRASKVVVVPDTERVESQVVMVRDITPPQDAEIGRVEVLPSGDPSA